MKINYIIKTKSIINRFGNAWLVRGSNGKTALVGGTTNDFTEAKEWVSLFAHDVVFSRQVKQKPHPTVLLENLLPRALLRAR
jgi:hypothetical protein